MTNITTSFLLIRAINSTSDCRVCRNLFGCKPISRERERPAQTQTVQLPLWPEVIVPSSCKQEIQHSQSVLFSALLCVTQKVESNHERLLWKMKKIETGFLHCSDSLKKNMSVITDYVRVLSLFSFFHVVKLFSSNLDKHVDSFEEHSFKL